MQITITHARYAPTWDSLQTIIRETTNTPEGKLTRISRNDNGCNYTAPGEYTLDYKVRKDVTLPIQLTVTGL